MKKYINFLLFLLVFSSCEDFLVRDHPTGITDAKFWKTTAQAEAALGQCKYYPEGSPSYSGPWLMMLAWEGASDNMYWNANFMTDIVQVGNGSILPTSGQHVKMIWEHYYKYIRRCCRVIENIDKPYFSDEAERERIRSEARVWRAWYHVQLLMFYGADNGIPLVKESLTPETMYIGRNSLEDCLEFINSELDDVCTNNSLPFIWDDGRRDRMSIADARAIQMRVNLQYHKYEKAKQCAWQIMDSGEFELYYSTATDNDPGKNYRDLFRYVGEKNKERILFRESGCSEFWFRGMSTVLGGQACYNPLKAMIDVYETKDGKTLDELAEQTKDSTMKYPLHIERDPRLYTSILITGDSTTKPGYTFTPFDENTNDAIGKQAASRSGYLLKKFLDLEDESKKWSGSLDFMIIRYAEVLLSYVECLVEAGDWQNAHVVKYLNEIRNRAGLPNVDTGKYNTLEKIKELYRRERRVELSFEGLRYFDIRRWGIAESVMKGVVQGAYNPNTGQYVQIEERQYSSPKNDVLPIPQTEDNANENISQPKGW
jgi:hypothetical protein